MTDLRIFLLHIYSFRHWSLFLFIFTKIAFPITNLLIIYETKNVINLLTSTDVKRDILYSLLFLGSIIIFSYLVKWMDAIVEEFCKTNIEEQSRIRYLEVLIQQDLLDFENGDYLRKLSLLKQNLSNTIFNFIATIGEFVSSTLSILGIIVIFQIENSTWLILLVILLIPISLLKGHINRFGLSVQWDNSFDTIKTNYYKSLMVNQPQAGEFTIFNLYKPFLQRWEHFSFSSWNRLQKVTRKKLNLGLLTDVLLLLFYGASILFFIEQRSALQAGDIYFYVTSVFLIISESEKLISVFYFMLHCSQEYAMFSSLFKSKNQRKESSAPVNFIQEADADYVIKFDNVSFAYDHNEPILSNVSFEIKEGERVALVGHNGAGKSTLYLCLLGLLKPTSGTVTIGKFNPYEFTPEERSRIFSAVFQHPTLYQGLTIEENISLGKNQIHPEFLKYISNLQLDHILGKHIGGIELSGGELQKVAITKALSANAKTIILDEPTSALDPRTEIAIIEEMLNSSKQQTLFVTTHRLGIVTEFDRVIVMSQGQLIEDGKPQDLLSKPTEFARMFQKQGQLYIMGEESL